MAPADVSLPTRRATIALGRRLARAVLPGDLVLLEGALGAGKTFLARAFCREIGVPRSITVASPTFALVHEYDARVRVLHTDLYRLAAASDARELGLREARGDGAVVLAEWAARFGDELGGDGLVVTLTGEGRARRATLTARGARGEALARAASEAG
jgi:tRNA threonylcarbamoyladenosine biosynthesis protein TsaE